MKKLAVMTLLAFAFILGFRSFSVQAATTKNGVTTFSSTIDQYSADVTGDGKADKIYFDTVGNDEIGYTTSVLKVNDVTVKSWNDADITSLGVKVITISKKSFIEIFSEQGQTTSAGLYTVKGGKLNCALNYANLVNKSLLTGDKFVYTPDAWDMVTASKVKGSQLYLDMYLGTKSMGQITIKNLPVKYSKKAFSTTKKTGKISFTLINKSTGKREKSFTAKKKITVYKTLGGKKKAKFSIKKNSKFKVTNAAIVKKNIYIKVKTSKGSGWIKLDKSVFVKDKGMLIWG